MIVVGTCEQSVLSLSNSSLEFSLGREIGSFSQTLTSSEHISHRTHLHVSYLILGNEVVHLLDSGIDFVKVIWIWLNLHQVVLHEATKRSEVVHDAIFDLLGIVLEVGEVEVSHDSISSFLVVLTFINHLPVIPPYLVLSLFCRLVDTHADGHFLSHHEEHLVLSVVAVLCVSDKTIVARRSPIPFAILGVLAVLVILPVTGLEQLLLLLRAPERHNFGLIVLVTYIYIQVSILSRCTVAPVLE